MIKLIIFDLDGVLVEARGIHYEALNKALAKFGDEYVINKEEHLHLRNIHQYTPCSQPGAASF